MRQVSHSRVVWNSIFLRYTETVLPKPWFFPKPLQECSAKDIENALKGMLKPEYEEVETGTAEIREIFRSSKFGNIAGSIVRSGEIKRGAKARITRAGVVIAENVEVAGLRRFKDDVTEVREGFECGINLGSFNDLQVEDLIATYEMREKPRD